MLITIDTDKINSVELGPSEYVILKLLFDKEYEVLKSLVVAGSFEWYNENTLKSVLSHLEQRSWIKLTGVTEDLDFSQISLRQKSYDLFEVNQNQKFLDLWNRFPKKVPNGNGGYRTLRAVNSDSDGYKQSLKKWQSIIKGKPDLPDLMIKALNKQLTDTRSSLQYTQMFDVWLNKRTWEKYLDFDEQVEGDSKTERL